MVAINNAKGLEMPLDPFDISFQSIVSSMGRWHTPQDILAQCICDQNRKLNVECIQKIWKQQTDGEGQLFAMWSPLKMRMFH